MVPVLVHHAVVDSRKLGRAIRARREALGLSQEATAHEAEISARYYADVERGTRAVSVQIASRIAAALDTKLQSILDAAERHGR
jgi:transcriptional regulator with XRE-family HTH domain